MRHRNNKNWYRYMIINKRTKTKKKTVNFPAFQKILNYGFIFDQDTCIYVFIKYHILMPVYRLPLEQVQVCHSRDG